MKIHLKFDHSKKSTIEALDCPHSREHLDEELSDIVSHFMENDELENVSHLAELIHNQVDYSAILYLATKFAIIKIESAVMRQRLKNFLDSDEII